MNPQVFSLLEKLKAGDIKSAMDQIKYLCTQISLLQSDIADIYTELNGKVDLVSEMQDGATIVTKIGIGVIASVTNSGTTLIGTGTLFTKNVALGNQIKIGAETTTITAFDPVTPDTSITVSPALTGTYTNAIYAIIKPATQEVLTGDFNFGVLNGDQFNGTVLQGSTFQHYGRMSQPNDIVNVLFVQKAVQPVMVRAQNAIQRNGDTITGPSTTGAPRYLYSFDYTNITFGAHTEVQYLGSNSNPTDIATMNDVDVASMNHAVSFSAVGTTTFPDPNTSLTLDHDDGVLTEYFTWVPGATGSQFLCNADCRVLVIGNFSHNGQDSNASGAGSIAITQSIIVGGVALPGPSFGTGYDNGTAYGATVSSGISKVISITAGQYLQLSTTALLSAWAPTNTSIHWSLLILG